MAFRRVPGTAQRYVDTDTGDTISRRQYERIHRAEEIAQRESRYHARIVRRREATEFIRREAPERLTENKRYWLQRFAEQEGVRRDITDRQAIEIERRPGSMFNKLWAAAEAEGFEGGSGSAWDALTYMAGAKGGDEDANERSKYLAVIAWYMRNDMVGRERWVARGDKGRFTWEGMPPIQRGIISRLA